ncbi:MAG: hypothetical protein ACJ73N_11925 [Bryobacteraceae bacterium]
MNRHDAYPRTISEVAQRFGRSFDELRNYFRPRRFTNEFVALAKRHHQQFVSKLALIDAGPVRRDNVNLTCAQMLALIA